MPDARQPYTPQTGRKPGSYPAVPTCAIASYEFDDWSALLYPIKYKVACICLREKLAMPLMPLSMPDQDFQKIYPRGPSIMTYQQYYNKLIKEIAESQKYLTEQNKQLKGEKGYFNKEDVYAYMHLRTELNALLTKSENVSRLITGGMVNPGDEIDLSVLPDTDPVT